MIQITPFKKKYWDFYIDTAYLAAKQSVCERHQVGAVVVTPEGTLSAGWNGTPSGMGNACENPDGKTYSFTIHAEANAIYKMLRSGIKTSGCYIFTTRSPCIKCSSLIQGANIKAVVYDELHDETSGLDLLKQCGVELYQYRESGAL